MSRRSIQVFNMSFLDMMTNFLGAVIILFLIAANQMSKVPFESIDGTADVVFNERTQEISGKVDPNVLKTLKEGDTLLVIVTKRISEDKPIAQVAPPRQQAAFQQTQDNNQPPQKTETTPVDDEVCRIFPKVLNTVCNDNKTPNDPNDDTFTAEVQINCTNKCGTLWKDNLGTSAFPYNKPKTYGPFPIKGGQKTVAFTDFSNPGVTETLKLTPPPPCSKNDIAASSKTQAGDGGSIPPGINFQIEFDENQGNVDLFVEKDGKWVFGNDKKDSNIGQWSDEKTGFINRGLTGLEKVRQLGEPIPGTYNIYAHYKKMKGSANSLKVSLIVSSKKSGQSHKTVKNVPFQDGPNPKRGGGTKLLTVQVKADGTLSWK